MSNKDYGRCLVCDDAAIGLNFGVSTCMPCKAFFRRNATKLGVQQYVCQNDGDCIISYKFRRSCNCCRLAKCFRVGMDKGMILSDEERGARNQLVEINRLKRGKIPKQQCAKWMRSPVLLSMSPKPVKCLSPCDQVILSNIFHAYESTCTAAENPQFSCFPSIQHTSIHEFLNEFSMFFPAFINYFKHIPEFERINIDDKVSLVKYHFGVMININEPLMQPSPHKNLVATWLNVFGIDITRRLLQRNKILEQYIHDPILLKIILIVLVLSCNNCRVLNDSTFSGLYTDPLSILAAQNVYTELLWRYALSRCGGVKDTVRFINKLIMCILYLQNLDIYIDDYISGLREELQQMNALAQNMWPVDHEASDMDDNRIEDDVIF
ncbi:unnamed protein product [Adineta ricciae]|uniref:Nuclear receptor domain-containing protein n=1 Tax=Adineta ricciae TaxID=249248 RepID=A0A813Q265_ADIRI|nr:unnamed protein product [Adineta ricciae]CAF0955113.1 unnamed protein product [Adineta ricciae]